MVETFKAIIRDLLGDSNAPPRARGRSQLRAPGRHQAAQALDIAVDTKVAQGEINKEISDRLGKIEKRSRMIASATDKQLQELSQRVEALEASGRTAKKKSSRK